MKRRMKGMLSIVLSFMLTTGTFTSIIPQTYAAATEFQAGTPMEAELGTVSGDMKKFTDDAAASGGGYIGSSGAKIDDPAALAKPEASYTIQVAADGNYILWFRYIAPDGGSDSFYISYDNGAYEPIYIKTDSAAWAWQSNPAVALKTGKHTMNIIHREPNMKFDQFILTGDAALNPAAGSAPATTPAATTAPATSSAPAASSTPTATAPNGAVTLEAESGTLSGELKKYTDDKNASGGAYINSAGAPKLEDQSTLAKAEAIYSFQLPADGSYILWFRFIAADGGSDSFYMSYDDGPYETINIMHDTAVWAWQSNKATSLKAGKHTLNIKHREPNMKFDKFILTTDAAFNPDPTAAVPGTTAAVPGAAKNPYPDPSIKPISEHPRVLLRKQDIPALKDKVARPEMQDAWNSIVTNSNKVGDGKLTPPSNPTNGNFNQNILSTIQANALRYVVEGDRTLARKAIDMLKNFMDTVSFMAEPTFASRNRGSMYLTGSIVYDWCYDVMTADERKGFITSCYATLPAMEIGWPPTKGGSIVGHSSEDQLMRDEMALGIAIYDENPEVYNIAAGRFFKEMVPARNFSYPSNMVTQGDSYGIGRFEPEVFSAALFGAMGYKDIYVKDQGQVPYSNIYMRRPDGQLLRDGDSFGTQTALGGYWVSASMSFLVTSYLYKDPYIKDEFLRQNAVSAVDPLFYILFVDPDVESKSTKELPQARYFGGTMGAIYARTGWETNSVVAEMKLGVTKFNNHQHLDSGHFQIYYKGILANDSGIYQGADTSYGTPHDMNYHKQTIAHNTMLVLDPNEKTGNIVNVGGQKWPAGGSEPGTLEFMQSKDYQCGEVLAHQIGPDPVKPDYTYLKGDLTKSYTDKVKQFQRSFVFLDLKNGEHPAAMIVFDKVQSSNPSFKKTWLLHSMEEPDVQDNVTTIKRTQNGSNGKMVNETLLPASDNLVINKVGGPGKEFMVGDKNFPASPIAGSNSEEAGAWRIEVAPKTASATDLFLNVMQVMDEKGDTAPLETQKIESDQLVGAKIADRVVLFAKSGDKLKGAVSFEVTGSESDLKYLIADASEGYWTVEKDGQAAAVQYKVTAEGGMLYFVGAAGKYTLTYSDNKTLADAPAVPAIQQVTQPSEQIYVKLGTEYFNFDVAPIISNDRVLVPFRAILEKLGATVGWDEATGTVTAVQDDTTIKLRIGDTQAEVNGQAVTLDVAPITKNGRTLIPLRFISENLGCKVTWNDLLQTATISVNKKPAKIDGITKIPPKALSSSSNYGDTTPQLSFDNDLTTYWCGSGDGEWIQADLGTEQTISGVGVAWNKGDKRVQKFDILVSGDGSNWTTALSGQATSGKTVEIELFDLKSGVTARYVKMVCHGNTEGFYNSPLEIIIYKK